MVRTEDRGRIRLRHSTTPRQAENSGRGVKIARSARQVGLPRNDGGKQIELSFGKIAIVDAEDYERLSIYKWCAVMRKGEPFYAKTVSPEGWLISMHRLIMNAPRGMLVDHRDHNGLNNRKGNLRICTKAQNTHNRRGVKGSSSRHKGVHWDKQHNKYRAVIVHKAKRYNLGRFDDEDDAGRAYDKKARELFGEFAYLNFPEES